MTKKSRRERKTTVAKSRAGADTNKPMPVLAEAGGTGFKRFSGIVSEEFHPDLKGRRGMRVYREMGDNHPLIGGALRGMRMLIRQAEWPINPADNDVPEARYWAERLEECIYDMEIPWRQAIDEMLSMIQYGFCLMWIKYKLRRGESDSRLLNSQYDDGLWGWRSFEIRKQETIERWLYADDEETLLGAEQLAPPKYKLSKLPMERLVHLRFETMAGSPEARSGLRNAYRPYYLQTLKEEIEGIGIARDLSGYPVMEVPVDIMGPYPDSDQSAARSMWQNFVRKVKNDELQGAVVPAEDNPDGTKTGFRFRLMSSGGSRAIDINTSITRDRVDILVSLLYEFALLGALETGSRSLASDKTKLTATALGGVMDIITETMNLSAVARWCRLNHAPRHLWPMLAHGDIEKENVKEWVDGLIAAASAGFIVPTDRDEEKVREKFGLEQRSPEDEILQPPQDESEFGFRLPTEQAEPEPEPETEAEPEPESESEMMTIEEAVEWLGVPKSSIMRAIRGGKLPGGKIGAHTRIPRKDLIEFFQPTPPEPKPQSQPYRPLGGLI